MGYARQAKQECYICATIINDGGYIQNECAHRYSTVVLSGVLIVVESPQEKQHGMKIIIDHLEDEPKTMLDKLDISGDMFANTAVLRLGIKELTCKIGQ